MTYILGAVAGLVFGGIVGSLKHLVIWHKYEMNEEQDYAGSTSDNSIYARAMISYFVNILTLLVAFLVRNIVPFNWMAFLIATAFALVIMNHVWALRQKSSVKKIERRSE